MRKLRTPEDIQALPGYLPKIDPRVTPLKRILDYYYIRPFEIKCGLCGKTHMDGCIVELENGNKSGNKTNIGHICGDRFGERFDEEKRKFSESERKPQLIKKLVEANAKLSSMHFKLQELKHRAGAIARRAQNFARHFPDLQKEFSRRAVNNQHRISVSVELSKEELDEAKAANPYKTREELRFKEEDKGSVRGYKFPAINWSFKDGVRSVFIEANQFADLSPRSMSMPDLTKWANWGDDLDEAIGTVVSAIKEAEEFFSHENFQLFQFLPSTTVTRDKLKSFNMATLDMLPVFEAEPDAPAVASIRSQRRAPNVRENRLSAKQLRRLTGNKKAT